MIAPGKILITQSQLYGYSGSEIVTLELIEHFTYMGWTVEVLTHFCGGAVREYLNQIKVKVTLTTSTEAGALSNKNFDIIWVHHYTLVPGLLDEIGEKSAKFIFHHMSYIHPLEAMQQAEAESQIADLVLFNSHETLENIISSTPYAKNANRFVFNNPAPDKFKTDRDNTDTVKRVAIVSNHPPEEIIQAAGIVTDAGVAVDFIGVSSAGKPSRVTPSLLSEYDVVVTIGKTVQYAMLMSKPVYCYDWFGGPGYLNSSNIEIAARNNFSGRGFNKKSAEDISRELIDGYKQGVGDIHALKLKVGDEYTLSKKIESVLTRLKETTAKPPDAGLVSQLIQQVRLVALIAPGYAKYINEGKLFEGMYVQKRDMLVDQERDYKLLRQSYDDISRDYTLAVRSKSYRLGRLLLLPLRSVKWASVACRQEVGLIKNNYLLKKKIDKLYHINRRNNNAKLRVDVYIRSFNHPTSSTYIRIVSPFSDGYMQSTANMVLRDGERLKLHNNADAIVVQRTAIPHMSEAERLVRHVLENKIKLFVDTDDAFGELDKNHPQYELQKERVDALNHIIENADEVWFSTEKLQRLYSAPKSKVVLNTLDQKIWPKLMAKTIMPPPIDDPLRVVYMGTVTHNQDFEMIIPALDRLHQSKPGEFKLYVIGVANKLSEKPWIEVLKPESALYPDFVAWFSGLPQFDIGLSPLVDDGFNKSKSDIKCLDYLANGIKPVVSDVDAYSNPELDEHIVRVESTIEAWYATLEKEVNNRSQSRKHMQARAKKGFNYITNHRSTSIPAQQIRDSIVGDEK